MSSRLLQEIVSSTFVTHSVTLEPGGPTAAIPHTDKHGHRGTGLQKDMRTFHTHSELSHVCVIIDAPAHVTGVTDFI